MKHVRSESNLIQFQLILMVNTSNMRHVALKYTTAHLSHDQAQNLGRGFEVTLSAVLQQPNLSINAIEQLPEEQKHQILAWNSNPPDLVNACIHDQFAAFAAKQPDEVAVDAWDGLLTYAQLASASSKLAQEFHTLGVRKGDRVMVCSEKSKFVIIAWLAVFKAGGVLVPVDVGQPLARLEQILVVSKAVAIASTRHSLPISIQLSTNICVVDEACLGSTTTETELPEVLVSPQDTAYVMFTSGSTGMPKGITVTHSAFCSGMKKCSNIFVSRRFLNFASFSFTPALYEVLMPVCVFGSCVCIPSDHTRTNDLANYMNKAQIDVSVIVPSLLRSLDPEDLTYLKTLLVLGEPIPRAEAARWTNRVNLLYCYASSENGIVTFNNRLDQLTDIRNVGFSSGTCWIVDPSDHNRLLPIGAVGEVVVYSPSTASSYIDLATKSREAFPDHVDWAPNPRPGFRFCRTGDLMYFNSDGSLSFSGRKDMMVKVRGQRIELSEVERAVAASVKVKHAMICVPREGRCAERLTAVLTLNEPSYSYTITSNEIEFIPASEVGAVIQDLQQWLLERLPEYMVPGAWIIVKAIPTTASGKLNRVQVLKWIQEMSSKTHDQLFSIRKAARDEDEPLNEIESVLQEVWMDALKLEASKIGRHDSFLHLGGDSISAITVVSACRRKNLSLSVMDILRSGSLLELAHLAIPCESIPDIEDIGVEDERAHDDLLPPSVNTRELQSRIVRISPCAPMQESIFLSQLKTKGQYECSFIFKLVEESGINPDAVAKAWQMVVDRHSILRTIITEDQASPGSIRQVVLESFDADVSVFKFRNAPIDPLSILENHEPILKEGKPQHAAVICQTKSTEAFLKLDISHVLFDGYSISILLEDLRSALNQELTGLGPRFTDVTDFLKRKDDTKALEYWTNHLEGLEPCHLPTLVELGEMATHDDCTPPKLLQFSRTLLSSCHVISFARGLGLTTSAVLQLAWALVLRRLLNRDDVAFGQLASARDLPVKGIERMVGPLVNMLIRRFRITDDLVVRDALQSTHLDMMTALSHQHVSLGRLQHALGINESLFSTSMSIIQSPIPASSAQAFTINGVKQHQPTEFDMNVLITLCGDSIEVHLDSWSDRFSPKQSEMILETYLQAIDSLSVSATRQIGEVDIVSSGDRLLVHQWAQEYLPSGNELDMSTLHGAVLRQSRLRPEAEAICAWDGSFSYAEMDKLSGTLAQRLQGLYPDLRKGSYVPLCFVKSRWAIIAMLAVLRAGWAYVPLDSTHPDDRLRHIIAQTEAKYIIVCSENRATCTRLGVEVFCLDPDSLYDDNEHDSSRGIQTYSSVSANDDAYVIFTSGSTGEPKGVVIQHRAVCNLIKHQRKLTEVGPTSRVLQFGAFVFDICIGEIFTALSAGACLCIPSDTDRLERLSQSITSFRVTWASLTPSHALTIQPTDVPTLQILLVGGEAVPPELIHNWIPYVKLINGYGPTETTVYSSMHRPDSGQEAPIIGTACGTALFVVEADQPGKLVPIGSIGELLITGPQLARGYLKDLKKTSEAFVRGLPWALDPDQRFYRTGDLVRFMPDGKLFYIGRKDNQIKIRGFRVELGEIESNLRAHPEILNGLVILPRDGPLTNRIVAIASMKHVQPSSSQGSDMQLLDSKQLEGAKDDLAAVKDALANRLPPYMIPSMWLLLQNLPLNTSGKVDRGKIKAWLGGLDSATIEHISTPESSPDDTEDWTETERQLQEIWESVLNKKCLSRLRSFMSLGGDSLTAMQVVSRSRQHGIALTVRDTLRCESLSELASKARELNVERKLAEEQLDVDFDLSPIQQAFFHLMPDGKPRFNQSFALQLKKHFSALEVNEAVRVVVERHSMLRARFHQLKGEHWRQRIPSPRSGSYVFCEQQVATEDGVRPLMSDLSSSANFDLLKGPLFATHLITVGHEESQPPDQYLLFIASHLVVDLVSWRVILQDFEETLLGRSLTAQKPLAFQAWTKMQSDYSEMNHHPSQTLIQEITKPDYAFWGLENDKNVFGDGEILTFTLDEKTSSALLGHANLAYNTEAMDLMIAAVSRSFDLTFPERQSPSVFYEGHGRDTWDATLDVTNTVGWFTTMAPLCCGRHGTTEDYIIRAKDLRRRTPGNGWPFFCSQHLNEQGRQAFSDYRRPEILFNYTGMFQQLEREESLMRPFGRVLDMQSETRNYSADGVRFALIDIVVTATANSMHFTFVYNKKMKHQDRIATWVSQCEDTLKAMARSLPVAHPEMTLADMPLMPLDWDGLPVLHAALQTRAIKQMSEVESVYPLSKIQEGMMLSQKKDDGTYMVYFIIEFVSNIPNQHIDVDKLSTAWSQVVKRHPMLRTIFIDDEEQGQLRCQVTLRSPGFNVETSHYASLQDARISLEAPSTTTYLPNQPLHRFTLCTTDDGKVLAKLELDHKIIDGYSLGVLIRDMALAYDEQLDFSPGPLYSDYIHHTQKQSNEDQMIHWKQYLQDVEPCVFPSLDGAGPEACHQHVTHVNLEMGTTEIDAFCKSSNITLFALIQVSWGIVLRAFTGSDDVCFGYLSAGRDVSVRGIENLIGPVINMMVCRLQLGSQSTLDRILEQCQDDFLRNIEFQHAALSDIQHALGISYQALFNTILSLQKSKEDIALDGSIQPRLLAGNDPTEYAIAIDVRVSDHETIIEMECQASQFSSSMTENIASTFAQVIRSVVRGTGAQLAELELVSPQNLANISQWNKGEVDIVDSRMEEVISDQARRFPDKEAVVGWDGRFTYAELDDAADRVSEYLTACGVGPEIIVPFCFEKSVWTIVAMMAVLKAGGACAALDPQYPTERLRDIVEDTRAKLIVCSPTQEHIARSLVDQAVVISPATIASMKKPKLSKILQTLSTTDAAFVQFTSGSTGRPKGIVIEHSSMATSARAHGKADHMDTSTRSIQFASYTYDVSIEEIFTVLHHGGTVCVPSEHERMNDISAAITRYDANWADLTPTVAALINPDTVPSMKTLCLGGEAVRQDVIDLWAGKVELINGYGPAEASIVCACSIEDLSGPIESTNIGVGVGCRLWVVDPNDFHRLAPVGTIGELLIQGPILARGYLNDVEKTEKSFIKNPSWAETFGLNECRFYRTQDLVRYTSNGTLLFSGRSDSQVKIRGQRVELADIEFNLSAFPELDQILVDFPTQGSCAKQLVAVVSLKRSNEDQASPMSVLSSQQAKDIIAQAKDWISTRLPRHMVPHTWAVVSSMPLNSSGKLDRKIVKAWVSSIDKVRLQTIKQLEDGDSAATPTTLAEQEIQKFCAQVLNKPLNETFLTRSFMNLGGDSITAMRLCSQARATGWIITVQSVLRAKSIAEIASSAKLAPKFQKEQFREEIDVAFELSPIQKLFFYQNPQGENYYNQSFALQLTKSTSGSDIDAAIRELVSQHSMLRCRFEKSGDGQWQQRITRHTEGSYIFDHFSVRSTKGIGSLAQSLEEGLDIQHGPLFRVALFDIGNENQVLFLVAHHLIIDLVSWRVLLQDMETLLGGGSLPNASRLSFQSWSSAARGHVENLLVSNKMQIPTLQAETGVGHHYWDLDPESNTYENTTRTDFRLAEDLTALLLGTANESLSTEAMDILLGCLVFSFKQVFPDRTPPTVYAEGHGREVLTEMLDPAETVGWFTILKPFFVEVNTGEGLVQTIIRTKDTRRKTDPHALPQFASILEEVLRADPTVEVLFNFLGQFQQFERKDALFQPLRIERDWYDLRVSAKRDAIFDIAVEVVDGQLRIQFLYAKELAQNERVQSWISGYHQCLQQCVTDLQSSSFMPTLGDFPGLKMDHAEFNRMLTHSLPQIGIKDLSTIQDIYPCSGIQRGMLLGQAQSPGLYQFHIVCEAKPHTQSVVDVSRLENAWRDVVSRHTTLRTIIVEGPTKGTESYQVVIRNPRPEVQVLFCQEDDARFLDPVPKTGAEKLSLPHNLRICQTFEGRIFLNLEMSHVFTDGASMTIIQEDLMSAYNGKLSVDGPLYRDYIGFLEENDRETDMAFWKEYLDDLAPTHLKAPSLEPNLREENTLKFALTTEFKDLVGFCAKNEVTISNLVQLTWALVLRIYTNTEDVCFGYLSSGRDAPVEGASRMIGPLIQMLACRLRLPASTSVLQALQMIKDDFLRALPHQYLPLVDIQHLHNARLQGRPLFNTVMSIQRRADLARSLPFQELVLALVSSNDPTEYDCAIGIDIMDDSIAMSLSHWTDKISTQNAKYMGSTFMEILHSLVEHPDLSLSQLQVTPASHVQQLFDWNKGDIPIFESCLHSEFEWWAKRDPDREAICSLDGSYTYGELKSTARAVAKLLQDRYQVGPETLVPICFDKSSWAVVGMMAVLMAGGAMVPIDPAHPSSRKRQILESISARFTLTSRKHAGSFQGISEALVLDDDLINHLPNHTDNGAICPSVTPANTACVIFTSGSTGKPKGIVLEHSSIMTSCAAHGDALGIGAESRVIQFTAYHFDLSLSDHWATLTRGGCVCIPTEEERLSDLPTAVKRMRANSMFVTPTVATLIDPKTVPTITSLILGGESVSRQIIQQWSSSVALKTIYGPAESSILCIWTPLQKTSPPNILGKPIASRIWVTQPQNPNILVPIGSVGEVCIQGPLLARGYLNDPDRTSASFLDDPSFLTGTDSIHRSRIYRTGDLARQNDDGSLSFIGRKDNQVKLHGQRLELEDIEHKLQAHESIKNVLVLLPSSGPLSARLVAVLTPAQFHADDDAQYLQILSQRSHGDDTCDTTVLQNYMAGLVPSYMVPSVWVVVNKMPLSPTGKLHRRQVLQWISGLSSIEYQGLLSRANQDQDEDSQPRTDAEATIQSAVAAVLSLPLQSIGLGRSFMSLGGDSISAMQVLSRCRASGINVIVRDILKSKTLRDLALLADTTSVTRLNAVVEEGLEFTLTPVQRLYLEKINHDQFQQWLTLEIHQDFTTNQIKDALSELLKTHPMLRSRLHPRNSSQAVHADLTHSFIETRVESPLEALSQIDALRHSIDAENGPVFGALLLRLPQKPDLIWMTAHHLVVDEISWTIIREDLESLLTDGRIFSASTLPFQAWAELQRDYAAKFLHPSIVLKRSIQPCPRQYWGSQVRNTTQDVAYESFQIDREPTRLLMGECNAALNTQPVDIMLASVLHSFGEVFRDRRPPTIFTEGHGREPWREDLDVSRTIGWFTSMYPIVVDMPQTPSDVLRSVKDNRRAIPSNGWAYLASSYHNSEARRTLTEHKNIEVLFNYLGQKGSPHQQDTVLRPTYEIEHLLLPSMARTNCPRLALFEINGLLQDGRLEFTFAWNKNLEHQVEISKWIVEIVKSISMYTQILPRLSPSKTLSDFPLLPYKEDEFESMVQSVRSLSGLAQPVIESAYPCTPLQEGILMSQMRNKGHYGIEFMWKIASRDASSPLAPSQIANAWLTLVQRHSILRTVFVDSVRPDGVYDQVVLQNLDPRVLVLDDGMAVSEFTALDNGDEQESGKSTLHLLSLSRSDQGEILCKLGISHAIVDGWSMSLLLDGLISAIGEEEDAIQTSSLPFSEYVQHRQQISPELSLDFWKRLLSGITPCHLLRDAPETVPPASFPSAIEYQFGKDASQSIFNFCKHHSVTPASLFQAAWALILRTYTGSHDVCFGYLSSGRDAPLNGIEDAIGPYISMLVSRNEIGQEQTLLEVIESVQQQNLDSKSYQGASLASIQHVLGLADQPMFNTVLSIQRRTTGANPLTERFTVEPLSKNDPTEYTCAANVFFDGEDDIALDLSYWPQELAAETANAITQTMAHLIPVVVADPLQKVADIAFCSTSDLQRMQRWNSTDLVPVDSCIHMQFTEQALKTPNRQALCAFDVEMTYQALDDLSTSLGAFLQTLGVGPEVLVPLYFEKSAVAVVCMLAIMKAGAGYVPLDPSHPMNRIETIIRSTNAKLALSSPTLHSNLREKVDEVIPVDLAMLKGLPPSKLDQNRLPSPSHTAVVIFTSGSTGTPKGVVLEHRALCSSMKYHGDLLNIGSQTRALQFAAYVFDASLHDIFSTLTRGGCVCIPSEEERLNDLAGAILRTQANWACLTTTVATTLGLMSPVTSLKGIALGGEPLTHDCIQAWEGRNVTIHNLYGPCESSIFATAQLNVDMNSQTSNVGRPICGHTWIVDPHNHNLLLPVGSIGELLLQGPLLARCYLGKSKALGEAFVAAPRFCNTSSRCYKTGDLARFGPDGSLHIIGRKDTQVKVNGQRIELGEIEHHFRQSLPSFNIVVDQVKIAGSKYLAAFLAGSTDKSTTEEPAFLELRSIRERIVEGLALLDRRVMAYMIPKMFLPVTTMPKTTSGKIDRRMLRNLASNLDPNAIEKYMMLQATLVQPSNPVEVSLRNIWGQVLGREPSTISTKQTFAQVGGDSVLAMQLAAKARAVGINILVQDIIKLKTIQSLAKHSMGREPVVHTVARTAQFQLLPVTGPALMELLETCASRLRLTHTKDIEDAFPCSPIQEGILISQAKSPGSYIIQSTWKVSPNPSFESPVHTAALAAAWAKVIQRHQALRSHFIEVGLPRANFIQVVLHQTMGSILRVKCKKLQDFLSTTTNGEFHQGDLPYAVYIAELEDSGEVYCKLSINHALSDGASMQTLIRDVTLAYTELTVQPAPRYSDYIAYIQNQPTETSLEFWEQYLEGASPCEFPPLAKCTTECLPESPSIQTIIPRDSVVAIRSLCAKHDISVSDIFKTLWALVLRSYIGSDSVCFGYIASGRDAPIVDVDNLVGPLINMLISHTKVDTQMTLLELMRETQDSYLKSLPHQYCSLKEVARTTGAHGQSLFNTVVNVLKLESGSPGPIFFEAEPSQGEIEVSRNCASNKCFVLIGITVRHTSTDLRLRWWH